MNQKTPQKSSAETKKETTMGLQFYNSFTRSVEPFTALNEADKIVKMYNCGPTVYDYCHIGNFRAYIFADLIRRTLELSGYTVEQVINITDVGHLTEDDAIDGSGEDKLQAAVAKSHALADDQGAEVQPKKAGKFDGVRKPFKSAYDVAAYYTEAFFRDFDQLGLKRPKSFPRATEYIEPMLTMIGELMNKGYAYQAEDGTVYFEIAKFKDYGKLSNNSLDHLVQGAGGRVSADETKGKRHPADFALWKIDPSHLMKWPSPYGEGFPGWHIECSAMSREILGEQLDIHTGGEDNRFPHHECEIAQSEAANGKRYVGTWLHCRFLLVDGEKMSKSKGNFYTIRDLIEQGYHPLALRWVLQSAHYQSQLNFSLSSLDSALGNIEKLVKVKDLLEGWCAGDAAPGSEAFVAKAQGFEQRFIAALQNNLNLPEGYGVVFQFAQLVFGEQSLDKAQAEVGLEVLKTMDSVLGVVFNYVPLVKTASLSDAEIEAFITERKEAKAAKNWARADEIRDALKEKGIAIEDRPDGSCGWKVL